MAAPPGVEPVPAPVRPVPSLAPTAEVPVPGVEPIPAYVPPRSPNPTVASAQDIQAAVAAGNVDQAAQLIAQSVSSGHADVVAAATALAVNAGTLPAFTQACSLAVTKYGASAAAVAAALSNVGGRACREGSRFNRPGLVAWAA